MNQQKRTGKPFRSPGRPLLLLLLLFAALAFLSVRTGTVHAATSYQLYGDAVENKDGSITLTPPEYWKSGSIWFSNSFPATDGMTVTFQYKITEGEDASLGYADGIVLNFATTEGVGAGGQDLGFVGGDAYGVELDSYQNGNDPEKPHVAIIKETVSNHLAVQEYPDVITAKWRPVKVVYKKKTLSVYVDNKLIVKQDGIELAEQLYVGVSAATGDGYSRQMIRQLNIKGVKGGDPVEYTIDDKPTPRPPEEITPDNPVPAKEVNKVLKKRSSEKDTKSSSFSLLRAKGKPLSNSAVKLSWHKIKAAKKYVVYGARCNREKKYKFRKLGTTTGLSFTQKNLRKGTYYKYIIVAVRGSKAVATSKLVHVATNGGKYSNPTGIAISRTSLTLSKGKTKYLSAVQLFGGKKVRIHRDAAYESSDIRIATVNKNGRIKALKKGTCYIYAYAQNGLAKRTKVTVK
ncbi:MAG: Ig-like domain-containing protein [Eubacterium sp.]|nr:Ig-like domain-containing protein [Eubacterium sp.]